MRSSSRKLKPLPPDPFRHQDSVIAQNPQARGYVLDDQAALRKHMAIFVDGQIIRDRARLTDAASETSRIYVIQALSGG